MQLAEYALANSQTCVLIHIFIANYTNAIVTDRVLDFSAS
jgi:hypothetical protein